MGLAPTGKRRLVTAHPHTCRSEHSWDRLSWVKAVIRSICGGEPDLHDLARPIKRVIDPLVALAMGVGKAAPGSVYEERGVSVIL